MRWLRRSHPARAERIRPVAEPMEPRLLYSADLSGGLLLGADVAAGAEQRTLTADGEYATASATSAESTVAATYAAMAMTFEENQGQAGAGIDFVAHGGGYGIGLDNGNAYLNLFTEAGERTVQLELVGALDVQGEGEGLLATRSNSIMGSDPSKWATDLANYNAVVYRGVYDGIDVRYYGNQRQLEYDFIVAAGADPGDIRLRFDGVEGATIAENGDLLLRVEGTETDLRFKAPVSYQRGPDGALQAVESRYRVFDDGSIGFALGEYDHARELVIDPVLAYATYFGGTASEVATDVVVGADGFVYVTGRTTSGSFPTIPNANELPGDGPRGGSGDIFVAKFSADLSQVIWSTRIGGTGDEQANAIAVDANGNVAVTGWTRSGNFPTLNADDNSLANPLLSTSQDAFVLKLNTNGGLVFSTYFGGNGEADTGNAVAFDQSGNVYVAGQAATGGLALPLLSSLLGGSENAFINKYSATGVEIYKKMLGGSGDDAASGIAVDAGGQVYVVGTTRSGTLALNADTLVINGHDNVKNGPDDGFLVRLDAGGAHVYSTFIGGNDIDWANAVAIDGNGKAYVVGETKVGNSGNIGTTAGAFQETTAAGTGQTIGFLRAYDTDVRATGSGLLYASLMGHANGDRPTDVAYARDRVVIVGQSDDDGFPTTGDAKQSTNENNSLFVTMIKPAGGGIDDLEYGTFYGKEVTPGGIAIHGRSVYVVGGTSYAGYEAGSLPHGATPDGTDALVAGFTNMLPNAAPVATGESFAATEDVPRTFLASELTANDTDIDGHTLSIATVGNAVNGAVVLNLDGTVTFTPAPNFHGTASFSYTVTDGVATTAPVTATLTVAAVNDAPFVGNDAATTPEDQPINILIATLLANDSDVEGSPLTSFTITGMTNGTAIVQGSHVNFTPAPNFNGTATFTYTVSDGTTVSLPATVTITVTAVNDRPVAVDDVFSAVEDTAITYTAAQILGNDTDVEGSTLHIVSVEADIGGTVVLNSDGSVTFTPAANFFGAAQFKYIVSDGNLEALQKGKVLVNVVARDDVPVGVADVLTATEDVPVTYAAADLLGNDANVDNPIDTLSIVSVTSGAGGTAVLNANGSVTFTPNANFTGTAGFTYTMTDGTTVSAPVSVTINVQAVNDTPVAVADSLAATEDVPQVYQVADLTGNDTDAEGTALAIASVGNAVNGTVVLNADGTVTFTADANYNGPASFTYTVTDGVNTSAPATVNITVAAVDDVPVAVGDALTATEDVPQIYQVTDLTGNDMDVEGTTLSIASVGNAVNGTVVLNADGTVTFTADLNYNGPASFTYTVTDGVNTSAPATVNVAVAAVDDMPVAMDDSLTATEDVPQVYQVADLTGNDTDVEGTVLAIASVGNAVNGTVVLNADGTITFTPDPDFNGVATFTYTVSDGTATSAAATVTVNVAAVNDAPRANDDALVAVEDTAITFTAAQLLGNDSDVDSGSLVIASVTSGAGGTAVLNADGTVTFRPDADYNGAASFQYTVTDGVATSNAATASVQVAAVEDAPVITSGGGAPVATSIAENTTGVAVVTATDVDLPRQTLVFSIAGGADASRFVIDPATGALAFAASPDFESPADMDGDNVYEVVVQVSDGVLIDRQSFSITVLDAPEDAPPPAFVPAPAPPPTAETPAAPAPAAAPAATDPVASSTPPAPAVTPSAPGRTADIGSELLTAPDSAMGAAAGPSGFEVDSISIRAPDASHVRMFQTVVFDRAGFDLIATQAPTDLLLSRFGAQAGDEGARLDDLQRSLRSAAFASELDRLRQSVREDLDLDKSVSISVASVSLGLSLVYVLWLIRGGVLLGSYLSALPAWRILDPLPVLSRVEDEEDEEEGDFLEDAGNEARNTLRGFG